MLLRDICHICKNHRESDGKDARHGDDGKVPPEKRQELRLVRTDKLKWLK